MTVPPDVARVLLDAADLIESDGWCQKAEARDKYRHPVHALSPRACRFCAFGAIARSSFRNPVWAGLAFSALSTAVDVRAIGDWNDAPGQTKAEVVAKLREVAGSAK